MEQALDILDLVWSYFRLGFYAVNNVQGLVIGVAFAYMMAGWRQLPGSTLLAVLVHVAFAVLLPVLSNGAALRLPPLVELSFWQRALELGAGYLIVISLFFLVKVLVLRRAPAEGHAGDAGHH